MQTQQRLEEPSTTSSSVRLVGVQWYSVWDYWDKAAPLIEKAIPYSDEPYTLEQIKEGIINRDFQLWMIFEGAEVLAAGVTQITREHCWIFALGGKDMKKWLHTLEYIKTWSGRPVVWKGRKGWDRVLGGGK